VIFSRGKRDNLHTQNGPNLILFINLNYGVHNEGAGEADPCDRMTKMMIQRSGIGSNGDEYLQVR
jgi:hypothetical protein